MVSKNSIDSKEAQRKSEKSVGAVWAGHQSHCGHKASHFLRGMRPNLRGYGLIVQAATSVYIVIREDPLVELEAIVS